MQAYEIRIMSAAGKVALTAEEIHLSDASAIRAGRQLADGRAFEVWRDLDCVHRADAYERKVKAANENTAKDPDCA